MIKFLVLEKTEDKKYREEVINVVPLNAEVCIAYLPIKRKIKRNLKSKIEKRAKDFEYVLSENPFFKDYLKGNPLKNWITYFPIISILHLTKKADFSQIAIVAPSMNELLKKVILELSEIYRIINVYTICDEKVKNFMEEVYLSVGLPINVKELKQEVKISERFIIRVSEEITVFDSAKKIEYKDLDIMILHPLSRYKIPCLGDILKVCIEKEQNGDISYEKMVKIVGEISK